ncbi:MAG: hypothetical protein P4M12_03320 [Gammaproteobacteria bacterium]|nr:hypothetical protein [Gammaproteobacteria bacterium]
MLTREILIEINQFIEDVLEPYLSRKDLKEHAFAVIQDLGVLQVTIKFNEEKFHSNKKLQELLKELQKILLDKMYAQSKAAFDNLFYEIALRVHLVMKEFEAESQNYAASTISNNDSVSISIASITSSESSDIDSSSSEVEVDSESDIETDDSVIDIPYIKPSDYKINEGIKFFTFVHQAASSEKLRANKFKKPSIDYVHEDDLVDAGEKFNLLQAQKKVFDVIEGYKQINKTTYGQQRADELLESIEAAKDEADLYQIIMNFLKDGKTEIDNHFCSFFRSFSRSSNTDVNSLRGMLIDNFVYGKSKLPRNKRVELIVSSLKNKSFKDNFELSFSEDGVPLIAKPEKSEYMKMVTTRAMY